MATQRRNLCFQFSGQPQVIGVQKRNKLAARSTQGHIAYNRWPAGVRQPNHFNPRISERLQVRFRLGVRAIVGDNQLPLGKRLREHRVDRRRQKLHAIESWQNDRYDRDHGPVSELRIGPLISCCRVAVHEPCLRTSTSSYIAMSFTPNALNDSSRSKCARTVARISELSWRATDCNAWDRAIGSSQGQSSPTNPAPVSDRKDGISVTTGGNPHASASIRE